MAVVLASMQTARWTFAKSDPGGTVGASLLIPILNPVGHQSTNWTDRRALMPKTKMINNDKGKLILILHEMFYLFTCNGGIGVFGDNVSTV